MHGRLRFSGEVAQARGDGQARLQHEGEIDDFRLQADGGLDGVVGAEEGDRLDAGGCAVMDSVVSNKLMV